MKTKAIAALVLASVVVLGVVASSVGARSGRITSLTAFLTLRPGVSRSAHHPVESGVYGELDGTFNSARSRVAYSLYYQGLNGFALRVTVRSRATGKTLAVLCNACHPVSAGRGRSGLAVSHLGGVVPVDPDAGFLITSGRTFVEIDTTAYPSGEIGGHIFQPTVFGPGHVGSLPRCC